MLTASTQKFLEKFGFPTFVAILLLGTLIVIVKTTLEDIQASLNSHVSATVIPNQQILDLVNVQQDQRSILKIICRNTAPNEFQAAQCER